MNLCDYSLDNLPTHKTLVEVDRQHILLEQIPNWQIIQKDNVDQLFCVYKCDDFVSAIRFVEAISDLAEQADHHPALLIEWGKVSVYWWSHNLKGLHINDFIMAAKTQQIYSAQ